MSTHLVKIEVGEKSTEWKYETYGRVLRGVVPKPPECCQPPGFEVADALNEVIQSVNYKLFEDYFRAYFSSNPEMLNYEFIP